MMLRAIAFVVFVCGFGVGCLKRVLRGCCVCAFCLDFQHQRLAFEVSPNTHTRSLAYKHTTQNKQKQTHAFVAVVVVVVTATGVDVLTSACRKPRRCVGRALAGRAAAASSSSANIAAGSAAAAPLDLLQLIRRPVFMFRCVFVCGLLLIVLGGRGRGRARIVCVWRAHRHTHKRAKKDVAA
jgi:hypothetical protein